MDWLCENEGNPAEINVKLLFFYRNVNMVPVRKRAGTMFALAAWC